MDIPQEVPLWCKSTGLWLQEEQRRVLFHSKRFRVIKCKRCRANTLWHGLGEAHVCWSVVLVVPCFARLKQQLLNKLNFVYPSHSLARFPLPCFHAHKRVMKTQKSNSKHFYALPWLVLTYVKKKNCKLGDGNMVFSLFFFLTGLHLECVNVCAPFFLLRL